MDEYQTDVEQDLREKKLLVILGAVAMVLLVIAVLLASSCSVVTVNAGPGTLSKEQAAIIVKPKPPTRPTREEYDP